MSRWWVPVLVTLVALGSVTHGVLADGEAGLVIQHRDGSVETFCLPFAGDSISGEEMLVRAGVSFEQVGGLVCAVGQDETEGCFGAASFASCTCECRAGGDSCVYWAYFTRPHGEDWQYSVIGFWSLEARDGDLQAWKWGPGGPSSAPAPVDVTFEDVCGHPPEPGRAIAVPTVTGSAAFDDLPAGEDTGGGGGLIAFGAVAGGLVVFAAIGLLLRRVRDGG